MIIKDFHPERQYNLDDFDFLLKKEVTNGEEKIPISPDENKPLIKGISVEPDSRLINHRMKNLAGLGIDHEGWIKLYRKSIHSQVFQNEGLWKTWTWCLLKANHEDKWVSIKTGKGTSEIFVKRGQFVFGRKTAAKELKMVERTVHKRMLKLKTMQNCDIKSDTRCSIVTILNYDAYQSAPQDKVTGKVTGKGQASDTNKNDKNIKIYVEGSDELRLSTFLLEEIRKNKPDFKQPNLQSWAKEVDLMIRRDGRKPERIRQSHSSGVRVTPFGEAIFFRPQNSESSLTLWKCKWNLQRRQRS